MKLQIRRASSRNDSPVPEAAKEIADLVSPSGYKFGETELYVVEVKTLEDLLSLVEREGPIIVSNSYHTAAKYGLEIYDDHVE